MKVTDEVLRLAATGDRDARGQMVEQIRPFMKRVAEKYSTWQLPFEDLLQEISIVVWRATARFDPDRGIQWSTYAIGCARLFAISVYRDGNNSRIVRLPGNSTYDSATRNGYRSLYCTDAMLFSDARMKRGHSLLNEGDGYDYNAPDPHDDQQEMIDRQHSAETAAKLLSCLSQRESSILHRRCDGYTLKQIGAQEKVSRERVRQLESRAIEKIREFAVKMKVDVSA